MSNTISRVLYLTIIYLVLMLPLGSSDLPKSTAGNCNAFSFGLASSGVYMCPPCHQGGGELLPRLSTLTYYKYAVYFCCTSLRVTSTGRYPAPCPMKLGLSSPILFPYNRRDCLCYSLFIIVTC